MSNIYETEQPYSVNILPENSFGYLQISVATGQRALPVVNARVSVFSSPEEHDDDLMAVLTTDASGVTNRISLPAPLAESSLSPGMENPYNMFYVRIVAADFITRDRLPVQIFPGILSDLIINMETPA